MVGQPGLLLLNSVMTYFQDFFNWSWSISYSNVFLTVVHHKAWKTIHGRLIFFGTRKWPLFYAQATGWWTKTDFQLNQNKSQPPLRLLLYHCTMLWYSDDNSLPVLTSLHFQHLEGVQRNILENNFRRLFTVLLMNWYWCKYQFVGLTV